MKSIQSNKLLALLLAVLLAFSLSGCAHVANETYSVPEYSKNQESAQAPETTPEPESEAASSVNEAQSAEEYLTQRVGRICAPEESYEYYFYGQEDYVYDLSYRVTEYYRYDTLTEKFSYLSDEDQERMALKPGEEYRYFTLELTAGERQTRETVNLGDIHLFTVGEGEDGYYLDYFQGEPCFMNPENYATVHDGYTVRIAPGETKSVLFVERVKKETAGPVYLLINTMGTDLFSESIDVGQLTDQQKGWVGVIRMPELAAE